MTIEVERLPGESIITIEISQPFEPERDMQAMFTEIIQLRRAIQGDAVMIIDVGSISSSPDSFSKLVEALSEASRGVKASQAAGVAGPPTTIFVGSNFMATLASQAMEQEQYGGVKGQLCTSYEEALALARARLSGQSGGKVI